MDVVRPHSDGSGPTHAATYRLFLAVLFVCISSELPGSRLKNYLHFLHKTKGHRSLKAAAEHRNDFSSCLETNDENEKSQ